VSWINRRRFKEIAEEQRAKSYAPFSKKEENDLVKWAKESGTAPDLEPWHGRTPNRLRKKTPTWRERMLCCLFGHRWVPIFFYGGSECGRCKKSKSEADMFRESLNKRRWWHRWTR